MRIVIALGGNALLRPKEKGTFEEQSFNISVACSQLVQLIRDHEVVLTHGNGPQVGKIFLQNQLCQDTVPPMPLHVCGAMSQGQIGYMLQQQLKNTLLKEGLSREVVSLTTQVVVSPEDPSFQNPTKPIGSFYSAEEAAHFMRYNHETWIEDSGRGWRKVVPSPKPLGIIEAEVIKTLLEKSTVVIASGGGGIPVIFDNNTYRGIDAVIEKDLVGELLAELVEADLFMCLTDVHFASLRYGTESEQNLRRVSVKEMEKYAAQGHFAAGSMGPKVEAALQFVANGGQRAVIAALDTAVQAFLGQEGTQIVPCPGRCSGRDCSK